LTYRGASDTLLNNSNQQNPSPGKWRRSVWSQLILGAGFAFAAAMQPGPTQSYLLTATMSRGWRRTLPAAFAPLLSDAPIFVVAVFFLSRVPPAFVRFLHLGGAAFLFYLAYGAFRTWQSLDPRKMPDTTDGQSTLVQAALVNFLNPNPWLGWSLVMGPLFLAAYRQTPAHGVALVAGFYGVMVLSLAGIISLFAYARSLGPRVIKGSMLLSVATLTGFAFYQLWMGIGH